LTFFSLPHAHLLNRTGYAKFHAFTLSVYNIQLRNIGKKHSLLYQSHSWSVPFLRIVLSAATRFHV